MYTTFEEQIIIGLCQSVIGVSPQRLRGCFNTQHFCIHVQHSSRLKSILWAANNVSIDNSLNRPRQAEGSGYKVIAQQHFAK